MKVSVDIYLEPSELQALSKRLGFTERGASIDEDGVVEHVRRLLQADIEDCMTEE